MAVASDGRESQNRHYRFVFAAIEPLPMRPLQIAILGLPESVHSTVAGLADVFNVFDLLRPYHDGIPSDPPFEVTVVGSSRREDRDRAPFQVHATLAEVHDADLVIVPALMVSPADWRPGTRPEAVTWLRNLHARGATLCSTCSGAMLLAETGLLDGHEATTHWAYEEVFRRCFPRIRLRLEHLLVSAGERSEIIMSGASGSWHDLALHLISAHVSVSAAQAAASFLLLEWHQHGQMPFVCFQPPRDHGDAIVLDAQQWLEQHLCAANPVDEVIRRSGLAPRTFHRRFARATGASAIKYVQRLRIEAAKRRLEQNAEPIDRIAWAVGYDDPAFFRRLFKRVTGITPGAYRRKLQMPPLNVVRGDRVGSRHGDDSAADRPAAHAADAAGRGAGGGRPGHVRLVRPGGGR